MTRHRTEIHMRWADQDVNRHVNNVTYAAYLQEARAHMLASGDTGRLLGTLVVVRMRVDYLLPLVYRAEPITAVTWISAVTAATVVVECEIHADDLVYCRGRTTLAPFDFAADRPRRITAEERVALGCWLEEPVSPPR